MPVSRLTLTDFRSYASATIEPGSGFVLLSGDNGAGKTNLLEAVSMLTPGRGLRGVPLSEMARQGGSGAWAVAAKLGEIDIGTGTQPSAPERRQVRINGAAASVNRLGEWLSVVWLTPAMDRLFTGSAGERRRFLDRLVLALEPAHAHHAARYEAAMRARNKLLAEDGWDETWLDALEEQMAEHGVAVSSARLRTIEQLSPVIWEFAGEDFPGSRIELANVTSGGIRGTLRANRKADAAAKRSTHGPNNEDAIIYYGAGERLAAQSSTGEQKALLIGLILAHAELVARRRGEPPLILLDEVTAHLDPRRRAALFGRLDGRGQVWMTATEAALFDGIGAASRFHVEPGKISPA
ncbi:DNA replication/repair protein RecF [Sphingomonas sp.]|uniref:DNA replication/repair protein RecF n=1 Tax=Sphingomonas sp. TaxID=28214 RepID=UPI0038AE639B